MRVHEISSIGKVTLDAFSFYVIIGEMEKAISRRLLNSYYFFSLPDHYHILLPNAVLILIVSFFPFCAPLGTHTV